MMSGTSSGYASHSRSVNATSAGRAASSGRQLGFDPDPMCKVGLYAVRGRDPRIFRRVVASASVFFLTISR